MAEPKFYQHSLQSATSSSSIGFSFYETLILSSSRIRLGSS